MGVFTAVSNIVILWAIVIANTATSIEASSSDTSALQLIIASKRGELSKVRKLAGPQCRFVNTQHGDSRLTPLMAAAFGNHKLVVDYLIACGASPDIGDINGVTATMVAAGFSSLAIVNRILLVQPNLNAKATGGPAIGHTALMAAAGGNTPDVVRALVHAGAHLDLQDSHGHPALHYAVVKNKKENVITLLKHGADPTIRSNNGNTAAELAIQKGLWDIQTLIKNYQTTTTTTTSTTSTTTTTTPTSTPATPTKTSTNTATPIIIALVIILLVLLFSLLGRYLYHSYKVRPTDRKVAYVQQRGNMQEI